MIELRWAVPPETTTAPPVLQYRQTVAGYWPEDWQDVPRVVVTPEAPTETRNLNESKGTL